MRVLLPVSPFLVAVAWVALLPGVLAQPASGWEATATALHADQQAHLWRVGAWGTLNLAGGLVLLATSDRQSAAFRHGLGFQSAAWGGINLGIAAVGLIRGPGELPQSLAEALHAENTYADILLVNLGLNVGYSAVGTTMVLLSYQGVRRAEALRGHGTALILQGVGLLLLDGIAYLGTRGRMETLVELAQQTTLSVGSEGLTLRLLF